MSDFVGGLGPTRAFIREHLIPLNTVLLLAGFAVAALDFLAPRLSLAPLLIYAATGALCAILLAAALLPGPLNRAVAALLSAGKGKALAGNPSWQVSFSLFALITLLGSVSVAKASSGGALASSFPAIASWQATLLDLDSRSVEIKAGTDRANAKLDALRERLSSPSLAGDGCPTLDCAVAMGASKEALQRHLDRGARLPSEPSILGAAIDRASKARAPSRLDILALYLDTKTLPDINSASAMIFPREARELQAIASTFPLELRPRVGEIFAGRNACSLPKLRLMEIAALNGDREMYSWLLARGADPSLRNQWCKAGSFATPFTAASLMRAPS